MTRVNPSVKLLMDYDSNIRNNLQGYSRKSQDIHLMNTGRQTNFIF